ncbi:10765_t:CDS:2 [Acaulospora morrowiae]|uniref:10765_t:CDS:1 n=1 Tax=Acaulospora morrowiae TaxID=94023 RepID=A0A9N9FD71_9GLOM|nr:10765_t:CDS:2 [Acaulospora morrowiae]
MSANENIRNTSTNIMPSQSNEMLSYEVFGDNSHMTEGDSLFHEESGKYDLDTVSVFVAKLYQLLDGDEYKEYLTWNETGDVFVICNMDEFAQNVLPKYFKHCKFTSFVRQLNIYGFYRVSDARKSKHVRSKHACVFSHSQFRRGRQDLLPNIRRKVAKTPRRKPRPSEPLISQDQGETNLASSPSSVYANSKSGSILKDPPSLSLLTSFAETKDFATHADKSDGDNAMRKRIAELTLTTENLRKDLKNMNDIVNERLLPEVRSLTEDLQKHHNHLIQLTQLVAYNSSPEDLQLLQASRGHTRHFPSHDLPSAKRVRLDDKQSTSIKMEQSNLSSSVANVPTVPSSSVSNVPTVPSSVPAPYANVFAPHPNNNLMNTPSSSVADTSVQGDPSVSQPLTISTEPHPTFNMSGSSIIGEFQHPSHNAPHNITTFNGSWDATCPLIQNPVGTVSSTFLFPTEAPEQSPIIFSPSSNQQNSSPPHSQQHSPVSSVAHPSSPTKYGDNTATSVNLISNAVESSNDGHNGGSNSPRHGDVIVSVSPTSTSPISQPPTAMPNYYHPPILEEMYNSFQNY